MGPWDGLHSAAAPAILECGGKRSATPLWLARRGDPAQSKPSPLRFAGALQTYRVSPILRTPPVKQNATRERVALRLSPAMLARKRSFGRSGLLEDQFVAFHRDLNRIVVVQMAFEYFLGQRIFEITLERTE